MTRNKRQKKTSYLNQNFNRKNLKPVLKVEKKTVKEYILYSKPKPLLEKIKSGVWNQNTKHNFQKSVFEIEKEIFHFSFKFRLEVSMVLWNNSFEISLKKKKKPFPCYKFWRYSILFYNHIFLVLNKFKF